MIDVINEIERQQLYNTLQNAYRAGELKDGKSVLLYTNGNGVNVYASDHCGFAKMYLFVNGELVYDFVSFVELVPEGMCFDADAETLGEIVEWLVSGASFL
jgi:hypothetical protein